jgi:putative glutamine amidotransferase
MPKKNAREARAPRVLVLEGLSGSSRCVTRAGGEPITVNPRDVEAVDAALAAPFDALLLTGGGDVDPRLYGEKPHRQVYGVNETRDYTEWSALDRARELGVPVLGICRGMQLMAVQNGGRLKQHVVGHRGMDHVVFTETNSRLRRTLDSPVGTFVSLHHQIVLRTGPGFRVAARAAGGSIEAIESRDGRSLGVQWHPEMDYGTNERSRMIFRWLVREAASRAGLVAPRSRRLPAERQAAPKRRAAQGPRGGQTPLPTRPKRKRPLQDGVTVSWLCPTCGLRFDSSDDREDHIFWLHGRGEPTMRATEPPPGHPDWIGS